MKYNGTLSKQQINQYTLIDYALMDRYTYYPSPLLVFGSNGYSKHYFIEGQRVMSRIGDIWDAEAALIPLDTTPDGVDLNNKADQIEAQLETHLACLALAGEVDYHVDLEWLGWETEPMVFFYHPDHLGSSSFITGATGEPTQHLEYLPFGELFIEERSTWNTPYKFSGKELDDETGYSYFGARYYDPNISIWLSVDPLSDKYPGHTPYNYTLNNPIRLIDPDGRDVDETAPGYGAAKRAATPEYNKRGRQTNNDYQPAFAKIFEQLENNSSINVRFVDDMSLSNSPYEGGTVEYNGTDQGGSNGALRDVYSVFWDPSITKELGTSGMFEEAKHLVDGLAGMFNLKSGSAGLTMQNEYDAKEWVVNNIHGI